MGAGGLGLVKGAYIRSSVDRYESVKGGWGGFCGRGAEEEEPGAGGTGGGGYEADDDDGEGTREVEGDGGKVSGSVGEVEGGGEG